MESKMANKKDGNEKIQNKAIDPVEELNQLRSIVFGAAEKNIYEQIAALTHKMEASISELNTKLTKRFDSLQQDIEQQFAEMDKRLSFIDKNHDDNEVNLQKHIDNLASEHEMFAAATQKDFTELNQSLDSESASLTNNFNEQLEQLKAHLDEVSNELSSSKTDRKTLARLLATMATNLEADQL
ncbi:hypothetical protein GCM10011501_14480 [Thalassotalea profundi]|uniref:Uncharacterized protein n=2 Tax=Thalassotalea profundi TaxID=2036687 RepID=A0ABQ3IMI9_9GAMM|nr:hypothetical protein GCM10011501_14480 [Thalassotalea profundi]